MDGTIGRLTWGTIKKPQLEDRTVHFKLNESFTHLSGLSKAQYAEIGYNPIRDEFELVCMHYVCYILLFSSLYNFLYLNALYFFRKMILIIMQRQF